MPTPARLQTPASSLNAGGLAAIIGLLECLLLVLGDRVPTADTAVFLSAFAVVTYFTVGMTVALLIRLPGHAPAADRPGPSSAVLAVLLAVLLLDRADLNAIVPGASGLLKLLLGIGMAALVVFVAARWFHRVLPWLNRIPWARMAVAAFAAVQLIIALQLTRGSVLSLASLVAVTALLLALAQFLAAKWPRRLLGLTAMLAACGSAYLLANPPPPLATLSYSPSVLLITLDTTRADHLGCYGYKLAATPNLDAFAESGCRFADAVSNAVETGPSHITMLTGRLLHQHGALRNGMKLPESVETLPDLLRQRGYRTAAFVSGWTVTDRMTGLGARFDHYDDELNRFNFGRDEIFSLQLLRTLQNYARSWGHRFVRNDRPAEWTTDRALRWLQRNGQEPFFLWLHYFDPHLPYEAPPAYDTVQDAPRDWYALSWKERADLVQDPVAIARMIARYDAEIAYMDAQLGRVLQHVQALDDRSDLLTIITADHGESMGEHEIYWGRRLYEPSLHVPLLIRAPQAGRPAVDNLQASHVDLLPTVLELLELPQGDNPPGKSLLRRSRGEGAGDVMPAIASRFVREGDATEMWSVRHEGRKLIWSDDYVHNVFHVPAREELYDLREDPAESINRLEQLPDAARMLRNILSGYRHAEPGTGQSTDTQDPDAIERLRTLGYLGD